MTWFPLVRSWGLLLVAQVVSPRGSEQITPEVPCQEDWETLCRVVLLVLLGIGRVRRAGERWNGKVEECHQPHAGSFQVRGSLMSSCLSLPLLPPLLPLPCFSVSSDQIEQLHRRFKQLSGDQPTIR